MKNTTAIFSITYDGLNFLCLSHSINAIRNRFAAEGFGSKFLNVSETSFRFGQPGITITSFSTVVDSFIERAMRDDGGRVA